MNPTSSALEAPPNFFEAHDVLWYVGEYLPLQDIIACARASKKWRKIFGDIPLVSVIERGSTGYKYEGEWCFNQLVAKLTPEDRIHLSRCVLIRGKIENLCKRQLHSCWPASFPDSCARESNSLSQELEQRMRYTSPSHSQFTSAITRAKNEPKAVKYFLSLFRTGESVDDGYENYRLFPAITTDKLKKLVAHVLNSTWPKTKEARYFYRHAPTGTVYIFSKEGYRRLAVIGDQAWLEKRVANSQCGHSQHPDTTWFFMDGHPHRGWNVYTQTYYTVMSSKHIESDLQRWKVQHLNNADKLSNGPCGQ